MASVVPLIRVAQDHGLAENVLPSEVHEARRGFQCPYGCGHNPVSCRWRTESLDFLLDGAAGHPQLPESTGSFMTHGAPQYGHLLLHSPQRMGPATQQNGLCRVCE